VSGALLAAASGVGFGVFQSVNARAVRSIDDPYRSTFLQLNVAAVVLVLAALISGDLLALADAPPSALVNFAIAGLLHFLAGWSLLNLSQQRIGAARTSPLLTTVPVFGVVIAAVALGQLPSALALVAIAVMCAGAFVVAMRGGVESPRAADAVPGLTCAFCWALSPAFTLRGLEGFDSPLAGLAVGMAASVLMFLLLSPLLADGDRPSISRPGLALKLAAGVLVALATWSRWAALEDAAVGVVLALSLLSVPIVLLVAPLVSGGRTERVTAGLWAGSGLVVTGALLLIAV
jgi:drug/metabolite transporter, DME family